MLLNHDVFPLSASLGTAGEGVSLGQSPVSPSAQPAPLSQAQAKSSAEEATEAGRD